MGKDEDVKSGEIMMDTKKGPVKMFLTHHAPKAAKAWWQPTVLALLAAATTWLTTRAESFSSGRDARDKDVIQLQEATKALWQSNASLRETVATLRERVAFLEGRSPDFVHSPASPEPPKLDDIAVDQHKLDVYQGVRGK